MTRVLELAGEAALANQVALAVEILSELRAKQRHASEVIRAVCSRHRLPSLDRAPIANLVYGVLRRELRLDAVLARISPRSFSPSDSARVWLSCVIDEPVHANRAEKVYPKISFADAHEAEAELLASARDSEGVALVGSLPRWLAATLHATYGEPAALSIARSLSEKPPMTIRTNRALIHRDALGIRLRDEDGFKTRPTALAPDALIVEGQAALFSTASFRGGLFEMQDEGSQMISLVVAPPPKSIVIDGCAGAGGKTLHLGTLLQGKGKVFAYDVAEHKLEDLRRRAKRAQLFNIETTLLSPINHDPISFARGEGADRVLIDAPCSGTGVLRRSPEARLWLGKESPEKFQKLQLEILERFANLVADGGRLIYSTCSLLPEENEAVVQAFLRKHPKFEQMPLKEILGKTAALRVGDGVSLTLRPDLQGTDGFFAAVFRRPLSLRSKKREKQTSADRI